MTDPATVRNNLDLLANDLDDLSKQLAITEEALDPIEEEYETFVDDFETDLWDEHEEQDAKLPSEAMRLKLARRAMLKAKPELRGQYSSMMRQRKKLEKQIASKKSSVSAQQSILSALKAEMEAAG